MNLVEGLTREIVRVENTCKRYLELPDGAGIMGASLMRVKLIDAYAAQRSGDVVKMVTAYKELKEIEGG